MTLSRWSFQGAGIPADVVGAKTLEAVLTVAYPLLAYLLLALPGVLLAAVGRRGSAVLPAVGALLLGSRDLLAELQWTGSGGRPSVPMLAARPSVPMLAAAAALILLPTFSALWVLRQGPRAADKWSKGMVMAHATSVVGAALIAILALSQFDSLRYGGAAPIDALPIVLLVAITALSLGSRGGPLVACGVLLVLPILGSLWLVHAPEILSGESSRWMEGAFLLDMLPLLLIPGVSRLVALRIGGRAIPGVP